MDHTTGANRLKEGDKVRDVVGMAGTVVRAGLHYTLVKWAEHTSWIKTRYLELQN